MTRRPNPVLLALGLVGWVGLVWLGSQFYATNPRTAGFDLELLLRAGRDVAAGRSPYDPALVAGTAPVAESLFYSYPPLVAQAMAAVAWVPSWIVFILWDAAAVAGLALVSRSLAHRFGPDLPVSRVVFPVVAVAPLCFPFAIGLLFGNLDVFFPLLYGLMILAALATGPDGDTARGGVALSAATVTKLHPGSMGLWFLVRGGRDRNARRVVVVALGVAVAALGLSLVVGGVQPWLDYAAVVRAGSSADLVDPRNAGPAAQVALVLGGADAMARLLHLPVFVMALALTTLAARRVADPVTSLAIAAAASLVILPVTWYHYPSALIPFGIVAALRSRGSEAVVRTSGLLAAAGVVAAIAILWLPILWLATGLLLAAVEFSAPRKLGAARPTTERPAQGPSGP